MVRTYKRKLWSRNYKFYSSEQLEKCLKAIYKGMTIKRASDKFGIPRNTISNKINKKHQKSVGKKIRTFLNLLKFLI